MIRLDNVSKIYRTAEGEVRAVDAISAEVAEGEFVALRGPSGSGKSTLLSLLGGLSTPTAGTVRVGDALVSAMSPHERARFRSQQVGFVFQMFHLLPYLNVLDNVLLAADPSHDESSDAEATARELLNKFNLGERLTHRPSQLSAGERQRVAMARALVNRPPLLLADEPTGNLDAEQAEVLLQLVQSFHQDGGTVILATHDDVAANFADRQILLRKGQQVEE